METATETIPQVVYSEKQIITFASYLLQWEVYLPSDIRMCLAIWKEYPQWPPNANPRSDEIRYRYKSLVRVIHNIVCKFSEVDPEAALLRTRKREVVTARQTSMFISSHLTGCTYRVIGEEIGGYDHVTVLHAKKVIHNLADTDPPFRLRLIAILKHVARKIPEFQGRVSDLIEEIKSTAIKQ